MSQEENDGIRHQIVCEMCKLKISLYILSRFSMFANGISEKKSKRIYEP